LGANSLPFHDAFRQLYIFMPFNSRICALNFFIFFLQVCSRRGIRKWSETLRQICESLKVSFPVATHKDFERNYEGLVKHTSKYSWVRVCVYNPSSPFKSFFGSHSFLCQVLTLLSSYMIIHQLFFFFLVPHDLGPPPKSRHEVNGKEAADRERDRAANHHPTPLLTLVAAAAAAAHCLPCII
jgi:hypothetical protein